MLARHFLARFAAEEGKRIRLITPEALAVLAAFHWPGNIRQLENTLFRAVVLAETDTIGLAELPHVAALISGQTHPAPDHSDATDQSAQPLAPDAEPIEIATMPFAGAPADSLPVLDAAG